MIFKILWFIIFIVDLAIFVIITAEFFLEKFNNFMEMLDNATEEIFQLWMKKLWIASGTVLALFLIGFLFFFTKDEKVVVEPIVSIQD